MTESNEETGIIYEGFATPCLICEGSDKVSRGHIIDPYAKTDEQDGLLCGEWSVGFEDGLVHIYLIKPVAAMCDERFGWIAKQFLLKEPINYAQPTPTFKGARKKRVPEAPMSEDDKFWSQFE